MIIPNLNIPYIYVGIFEPYRIKILEGGRGSAKSETVARYYIIKSCREKRLFLCTREYQNSVQESVYRTIVDIIEDKANNLNGIFFYNKQTIINKITGSRFIFKGLQDIYGIKSMKGITDCWVEEAHGLKKETLEDLEPTIRGSEDAEIIYTLNRQTNDDCVVKKHLEYLDKDVLHIKSTYRDNPYFPKVLRRDMLKDKERNYELYLHIWEGQARRLKGALFDLEWFSFIDADKMPAEKDYNYRFITADTAYKDKQENDYHCFSYWGVKDKSLYLIDVIIDKLKSIDVEEWCLRFIKPKLSYNFRYVWIEDKGHGIYLNQKLPSFSVPIPTQDKIKDVLDRKGDKVERANNILPYINKMCYNMFINRGIKQKVQDEIKNQLVFFPEKSVNDDFVDTYIDAVKIALATKDYAEDMRRLLYG